MPELPEVEIVKRGLEPVLLNNTITRCSLNIAALRYPFPDNCVHTLIDAAIKSVGRRGKYVLIHLSNAKSVILHLGMSGRVKIFNDLNEYEQEKHDHVELQFKKGQMVVYNDPRRFGFLDIVPTENIETCRHFKKMGPEPLGNYFSGESLYQSLRNKKAPIKSALLDQRVVAGVGNIYACEALYMARINPRKSSKLISKSKADTLAKAIKEVLLKAIDAGGSSLRDYAHTDGSLGYFQHMFGVYDREGEPCPNCDCNISRTHGIKRIVQTGRSTFFCASLQK